MRTGLVVAVDDDPLVRAALARTFSGEPYDFVTTGDPEGALDLVRTGRVDVLLSDYRMPVLSGTGVLLVVKATSPRTTRLLLTAYPKATWIVRMEEMGAVEGVLAKPWDNEELRRVVREALGQARLRDGR